MQRFYPSFYEDDSFPLLASPEADKWPGEMILPDFNYNEDCLVPDLLLMENMDDLPERFDDVGPEEELLSFLEEIITEDEKKSQGKQQFAICTRVIILRHSFSAQSANFFFSYRFINGRNSLN